MVNDVSATLLWLERSGGKQEVTGSIPVGSTQKGL